MQWDPECVLQAGRRIAQAQSRALDTYMQNVKQPVNLQIYASSLIVWFFLLVEKVRCNGLMAFGPARVANLPCDLLSAPSLGGKSALRAYCGTVPQIGGVGRHFRKCGQLH